MSKFIIFEGTDGSGKATQVRLLADFLTKQKIPFEQISFPRYEDNKYGRLIREYLDGKLGNIDNKKISSFFAEDRKLAKPKIEKWLNEGKLVIADRYVSSSKAHMAAKLIEKERGVFINWLDNLEFVKNKIPKEDLIIFLHVPSEIAQKNITARGRGKDLHEKDLEHLKISNQIYQELAKKENNWLTINCTEKGKMRDKNEIHKEIVDKLSLSR